MNMNKKVMLFSICMLFSFFVLNINALAAGCNTYASQGESVCIKQSNNGKKCAWDGTKKGGSRCYESDELVESEIDKITSCSDIKEDSVCKNATVNGDKCIWRQNACYTGFEDDTNDSEYNIGTTTTIATTTTVNSNAQKLPCNTYTTKEQCGTIGKCEWNAVEGTCDEVYVAEQPCSDDNIKTAIRFFGYLLLIAKVAIPLIIIVMGTIDLFKSVTDKDEKSFSKQLKILLMRIVAGVFVFFIPTIIYALFSVSSELNIVEDEKYQACVDCLFKPTQCEVDGITGDDNTHNAVGTDGTCPSGQTKGVDGICYNDGECGSYTTSDTCPDSCKWSYRNGCLSR